jgi:acetylornithine deacetylase
MEKRAIAAREEGVNAIYKAMDDIEWFRNYRFDKVSELLACGR